LIIRIAWIHKYVIKGTIVMTVCDYEPNIEQRQKIDILRIVVVDYEENNHYVRY